MEKVGVTCFALVCVCESVSWRRWVYSWEVAPWGVTRRVFREVLKATGK